MTALHLEEPRGDWERRERRTCPCQGQWGTTGLELAGVPVTEGHNQGIERRREVRPKKQTYN